MKQLLHLPLEPYKERYTENLADWEAKVFKDYFEYRQIVQEIENVKIPVAINIRTGEVLDSRRRPIWCLSQIEQLLEKPLLQEKIYCSDFYTPGLDAVAYANRDIRLSISAFLWAQTFDRYDFTRGIEWMRPWEIMAFEIYDHVFVACDLLKDLITTALPHVESKVHVVGLPFDVGAVQQIFDEGSINEDEYDCIYTSRWDVEKNPGDFLNLVELRPDLKFLICTGASELRGTDQEAIARVQRLLNAEKNLTCVLGASKAVYHSLLMRSKVQFNCALQDWVSFTLLEALAFNCAPLYPNFRSFPEALYHSSRNLYAPGNIQDASDKLDDLLADLVFLPRQEILEYHNSTLHRIANIVQGD